MTRLPSRAVVLAGAVVGLVLLAVSVREADTRDVLDGMLSIGWGFVALPAIAAVRQALRAAAWTTCAGGTDRLPFGSSFGAGLVGEAAGNLTPLGLFASEPAKVVWVRGHLDTIDAAASLGLETMIYAAATAIVLLVGSVVWVAAAAPRALVLTGVKGLSVVVSLSLAIVALWIGRRARHSIDRGDREPWTRLPGAPIVRRMLERARHLLGALRDRGMATVTWVIALQVAFQLAAMAEVAVTLWLLGTAHPSLVQVFLLEYANRVVTVVFKFVPLRMGVDEAASGLTAALLGFGSTTGVTLALARKARVLCLTGAGAGLVAVRAMRSGRSWGTACLTDETP
jgi:hypothetical protein